MRKKIDTVVRAAGKHQPGRAQIDADYRGHTVDRTVLASSARHEGDGDVTMTDTRAGTDPVVSHVPLSLQAKQGAAKRPMKKSLYSTASKNTDAVGETKQASWRAFHGAPRRRCLPHASAMCFSLSQAAGQPRAKRRAKHMATITDFIKEVHGGRYGPGRCGIQSPHCSRFCILPSGEAAQHQLHGFCQGAADVATGEGETPLEWHFMCLIAKPFSCNKSSHITLSSPEVQGC